MGFEVEVKYRVADGTALSRRLETIGARAKPALDQVDVYLRHPSRDFAQTNEALRIRRISQENRITYKGPRLSGPTKTREEIELAFEEGPKSYEQLLRLWTNLGFEPVAEIRKRRNPYHLDYRGHAVEIALDEADRLGNFAEVEVFADSEAQLGEAQEIVLELAKLLGLSDVEPRSYLRMILELEGKLAPNR